MVDKRPVLDDFDDFSDFSGISCYFGTFCLLLYIEESFMSKHEHVTEPDDERRCQGNSAGKQCGRVAEEGSEMCKRHKGKSDYNKNMYIINDQEARDRFMRLNSHSELSSLRNEIAMARSLLEERFNAIGDSPAQLALNVGPLNQLLLTIERLVKSAHTLEFNLGEVVGRGALISLAKTTSDVLLDELQGIDGYEEIIDRVGSRIFEAIMELNNNEEG